MCHLFPNLKEDSRIFLDPWWNEKNEVFLYSSIIFLRWLIRLFFHVHISHCTLVVNVLWGFVILKWPYLVKSKYFWAQSNQRNVFGICSVKLYIWKHQLEVTTKTLKSFEQVVWRSGVKLRRDWWGKILELGKWVRYLFAEFINRYLLSTILGLGEGIQWWTRRVSSWPSWNYHGVKLGRENMNKERQRVWESRRGGNEKEKERKRKNYNTHRL